MQDISGKRVAFLATDGVEQVELERPLEAVREAGAETTILSLKAGPFQGNGNGVTPASVPCQTLNSGSPCRSQTSTTASGNGEVKKALAA